MAAPQSQLMERKQPVVFTPERKELFLEKFRETGLLYLSAHHAGVVSSTVQDHVKRDPVFAELYAEAKEYHTDTMIQEAVHRATVGDLEPVIGGQFRDEIVTHIRRKSDRLMEFVVKSRREEFRDKTKVDAVVQGGVLVVPAMVNSQANWETTYAEAAKGTTGRPKEE